MKSLGFFVSVFFSVSALSLKTRSIKLSAIDTGSVHFGASRSRISECVLLLLQKVNNSKMHELILENANTNCMAARVNSC